MARSKTRWKLTDEQWKKIEPLLPQPKKPRRGGRPWADNRKVFEGILWILRTGAPWADLPKRSPSPSTCWWRLWEEQDVWLKVWRTFLAELDEQGQLDWAEAFVDGSLAPAKKGGKASERPERAKARSGWWWSTVKVFLWESTWTRRPRAKSSSRKSDSRHCCTATRIGSATQQTAAVDR